MRIIFEGMALGLGIAAPVGPIGLLCIGRALRDGTSAGLATGLGAACADAAYGLAVASGLGCIGWLGSHAQAMSRGGALLLLALGAATLRAGLARPGLARQGPGRSRDKAATEATPGGSRAPLAACGTAFALTAMNPATIVGFVGIIAALAPSPGQGAATRAIVLGVFLGSMLWWAALVALVRGTRHLLSPASMRLISLASAAWLLGAGLLLLVRSCA